MSLYGALYSGVSGLSAQSSAMGAISDNISNVNTTGYKGAKVNFNTLVTKQVSLTNYSPGGVQSKPRASIDVQGLLQATNSSTDVAISGQGFFVVNEAASPGDGDMFAYTRAGSFKVDREGYLQNVSGWYMQGWPLEAWDNSLQASTITVGNDTYMKGYKDDLGNQVYINDNIVSSRHLRPLNLNNIGGTASQTRNLRMGANLPNGDLIGVSHKQPVTIYDSLGGDATVQFNWKKTAQNQWGVEAIPPLGAKSMTLRNKNTAGNAGEVHGAMGRLDFLGLPKTSGAINMNINGTDYSFATTAGTDGYGTKKSIAAGALGGATTLDLSVGGVNLAVSVGPTGSTAATATALNTAFAANTAATAAGLTAVANGGNVEIYSTKGQPITINTTASGAPFNGAWTNVASLPNQFYSDPSSVSVGTFVGNLASDINTAFNLEYNSMNCNLSAATWPLATATDTLTINGTDFSTIANGATDVADLASQLNADANFQAAGLKAFANGSTLKLYSEKQQTITVSANAGEFATANWDTLSKTTTGYNYCEQLAGTNSLVFRQYDTDSDLTVSGLDTLDLTTGTPATRQGEDLTASDSFVLGAVSDLATNPAAIVFNGDGTPNTINVAFMDVDWANGSEDMSGADSIGLFLGNTGIRDGMTQLNGDYQLAYWSQNGAKFGNFAGVSIGEDGIVTALFDNGVTRPVFQIPVSTFVNPNGMQSLTGNVFISTDNSGEPTLRAAGSAGAGAVQAASLEASTVDIGTEFTTMIVTQRAYSAAAKIITTADQMLDELVQIKR